MSYTNGIYNELYTKLELYYYLYLLTPAWSEHLNSCFVAIESLLTLAQSELVCMHARYTVFALIRCTLHPGVAPWFGPESEQGAHSEGQTKELPAHSSVLA